MQNLAWYDLADLVALDLVKQRPQAHAELFRRFAAIAVGGPQGGRDRLPLRLLDRGPQRPSPFFFRVPGDGSRQRFTPKIGRVQRRFVGQHCCSLDHILELADIARPRLLLEPRDRLVADRERPAKALPQSRCEMASQWRNVL